MRLELSALAARLDAEAPAPVYVLEGEDLLREQALAAIENKSLPPEEADFNLDRFDGDVATAAELLQAANQFPVLAERRLVVVRRARKFVEPVRKRGGREEGAVEDEDSTSADVEAMVGYVKDPSPRTVLVLDLESRPHAGRKAWKEIEKRATVVACELCSPKARDWEKQKAVDRWAAAEARRQGLQLSAEQVRFLVGETGLDLRRIRSELEKVVLYAEGGRLGLDQLAEILGRGRAQHVFRFTDAVAARETGKALRQLNRLLDEGEPAQVLLALLDAKLRYADRFDGAALGRALGALESTDRALKSTGIPARLLLEGLVVKLCAVR